MPSKSKSQKRMMAAAAHDPAFAKKVGVSQTVAKEFNIADTKAKGKKLPERKITTAVAKKTTRTKKGY